MKIRIYLVCFVLCLEEAAAGCGADSIENLVGEKAVSPLVTV